MDQMLPQGGMQRQQQQPQMASQGQAMMQQTIQLQHSGSDMNGPRENHRNYVFVDEHNRHKRLKVMRACEGCRRRKIKCDAATTNTWPCSACVRLKLHCVPPMVQYDREFAGGSTQVLLDPDSGVDFDGSAGSGEEEGHHGVYGTMDPKGNRMPVSHFAVAGNQNAGHYREPIQVDHPAADINFNSLQPSPNNGPVDSMQPTINTLQQQSYHAPNYQSPWEQDTSYPSAAQAVEALEKLKIEDSGVASYINAQGVNLAQHPAYEPWEEFEANPSFMPPQHEFAVRIRPEDMPSDTECQALFDIFFTHVHPYLPIVNKVAFYAQWEHSRQNISPLLLESIFACAGRLQATAEDPLRGMKWISMATRHVECFMDVPRLSTVQALLLLLKARESAPQRGYFFRSWMNMVTIIAMARDLKLDKHAENHRNKRCKESSLDCMIRTRIWQTIFISEFMICAPQGRDIMQVPPETVDLSLAVAMPGFTEMEVEVHNHFVYFVYLIKNIRRMNDIHAKLKVNPNWRHDKEFLDCGPALENWGQSLPASLAIDVPMSLSEPVQHLGSHFTGNINTYFYLAKIMLHRPALAGGKNFALTKEWKFHMTHCYTSAKAIVRLSEAVFEQYGMTGVKCMMRGVNFTIYAMLTCTMIHMIAATCPDPDFNVDAKQYFARAMRILERCIDVSASAETKHQIEQLREAFSLDLNQPFVLNPNIPFYHSMTPESHHQTPRAVTRNASYPQSENGALDPNQGHFPVPLSPPQSAGGSECDKNDTMSPTPGVSSLVMMAAGQRPQGAVNVAVGWNPTKIFESWGAAFPGMGPPQQPPQASSPPAIQNDMLAQSGATYPPAPAQAPPPVPQSFKFGVSPHMWQDSVAAVYADTQKRAFSFTSNDHSMWPNSSQANSIPSVMTSPGHGNNMPMNTQMPMSAGAAIHR